LVTLGDLAGHLGLEVGAGDPTLVLRAVAPLGDAGPSDLAFLSDKKYLADLAATRAGCVILRAEWADASPVAALCSEDPYLDYARASRLFEAADLPALGVHATAVVDPSVAVPATARIGAHVSVGEGAVLGEHVAIEPGCRVGARVRLGDGVWLAPNVVLYHDVVLGHRCRVHAATVIGSDGFGFARRQDGWERISQLGTVRIGDDVDIGASVTIDRGAVGDTVIASGVIIDNQVHIAHNCSIGARTAIAGCVGMAGSVKIGSDCTFAGQVGVSGHLEICDNAHLTGQARVTRSLTEPGAYASGTPLEPQRQWARNAVRYTQLAELHRRVADLEARLDDRAQGKGDATR